jgi:hypothetical protein
MRPIPFLAFFAVCIALSSAQAAEPAARRLLVISAPGPEHPDYREQAAILLPAWRGLLERDFVVETRFGSAAFSVVLIGKDGGEKLRRSTPLAPADLFAIVDVMPMRQAEMKKRPPTPRLPASSQP